MCHRVYKLVHDNMNLEKYHKHMKETGEETTTNYDIIVASFVRSKLKEG